MGNAGSSQQAGHHPPPSRSNRSSTQSSSKPSSAQPKRRRKSVELGDSPSSLAFTQSQPSTGPNSPSTNSRRRQLSDRLAADLVAPSDDGELDDGADEVEDGTLRGAMCGKAEHVVYGPRVVDTLLSPKPTTTTQATETATYGGMHPVTRPAALQIQSQLKPQLTPTALTPDPDDTLHPGFSSSPRLTSQVLLSSDQMPVIASPVTEHFPRDSPFHSGPPSHSNIPRVQQSIASAPSAIDVQYFEDAPAGSLAGAAASLYPQSTTPTTLLPPHTSPPFPPVTAPLDTVIAPLVPASALPINADQIPSGTSVVASPVATAPGTPSGVTPSPAVLLPPNLFNAPVAAIPIPLLSVPDPKIAGDLVAAAVDLGAGTHGVPTLIKWKNEDGQQRASGSKPATGPKEVFVTGTFAKGWSTKIELRMTDPSDFSALISLPPGPHRLKFIVDREWKASKHLPVATDADGNLINYLQVTENANAKVAAELWSQSAGTSAPKPKTQPPSATASQWPGFDDEDLPAPEDFEEAEWTQTIPAELVEWGEWEAERDALEASSGFSQVEGGPPPPNLPPPPASSGVPPPSLPAQLEKGPLNHAAYVTQGSGDDNSILPKPEYSVINHLAASPIKGGFLSVGVTTRYKRKFVTVVYYKALGDRL